MLDIHPPHEAAHTWKDFLIHIATICVGLLIAIGLEQTVEALHHHHQREQLERQLRDEFRANLQKDEYDFQTFAQIRAYTVQLKSAVSARRTGKTSAAPPAPDDTRRQRIPAAPSIAVWEAAKLDATLTLLPIREIHLYNSVTRQHDLVFVAIADFQHSAFALESFEERFIDSQGAFDLGDAVPLPDLASMSPADLAEYEALLATYIKSIDRLVDRLHFFDRETRVLLEGATDEVDLLRRSFPIRYGVPEPSQDPPKSR